MFQDKSAKVAKVPCQPEMLFLVFAVFPEAVDFGKELRWT